MLVSWRTLYLSHLERTLFNIYFLDVIIRFDLFLTVMSFHLAWNLLVRLNYNKTIGSIHEKERKDYQNKSNKILIIIKGPLSRLNYRVLMIMAKSLL